MALFISFEGIDGCGKTTQIELLRAHLESAGHTVRTTREPGGTALAEAVREYLLHSPQPLDARTELLLFGAARAQHVAEIIRPALARGEVILSDRFTDSSLAYQGGGLGLDMEFIHRMNDFATNGLKPHLTFLLDVDPATGWKRRCEQRGEEDRIEERGMEFQQRVRDAFLKVAQSEAGRVIVMDGSLPAKVVHKRIYRVLQERGITQ
jgi:dTMP kinase